MKFKSYIISSLICIMLCVLAVAGIVYYVDPYMQYHQPREDLVYDMNMNDFMYYNPGIAKNFDYDTIITGSSMSRAFEPSYIDQKMDCKTVKLSMAEARGKDFSELLPVVMKNKKLKRVIIGLDDFAFSVDKDFSSYEKPKFLYDDNKLNDVYYLCNIIGIEKTVDVFEKTGKEEYKTTSMDEYQNYVPLNTFSAEKVKELYAKEKENVEKKESIPYDELKHTIKENLDQNLKPFIEENPEVNFECYFPPYSIASWGLLPNIEDRMNTIQIIIEELIGYKNVSLYFFPENTEIIEDLDHYMDTIHFDSEVAHKVVDYMSNPDNKLDKENYMDVLNEFREWVENYDYAGLLM